MNIKDGGPAYPGSKKVKTGMTAYEELVPIPGMSLRDYFAAKAMQGIICSPRTVFIDGYDTSDFSGMSYYMADKMLSERDK